MNLLVTGAWRDAKIYLNQLESLGYTIIFLQNEKDVLPCEYDWAEGVICNGLFQYHPIEKFSKLKYIQLISVGCDRVPMEYIQSHEIKIFNAKGVYGIPIAEWAVMSILQIYKNAYGFFRKQQAQRWEKDRSLLELTDKKICIIGYGDVGHETANRLAAFGTEITAVNRSRVEEDGVISRWLPLDRLDEALSEADIVILCIALTEETRGLLNADRLRLMKQGSILVNVARGPLIDEKALISCLKEGKLRGAALDVFETEPLPAESELWEMSGVIIGPHNSFVGDKVRERMFSLIYRNLEKMLKDTV